MVMGISSPSTTEQMKKEIAQRRNKYFDIDQG